MPVCMCHSERCCLFAWGIFFSWHVSWAVKAYCVWVITCHRQPRAPLTPRSRIPSLSHSLSFCLTSCQPSFLCSLPPCFSFFCFLWVGASCHKRWHQGLEVGGLLWSGYFILFFFFFSIFFPKGNQPLNIRCRSSWNSCQAWLQLPFVKARNNWVQRLFWWWQVHWQYPPSAWAVHITAWKSAGCFLCLFGASVACCAQCGMMALCRIAFWIVEVYFRYDPFFTIYSGLGFALQSSHRIVLSCRDSRIRADF